jgi:hypothetical protein
MMVNLAETRDITLTAGRSSAGSHYSLVSFLHQQHSKRHELQVFYLLALLSFSKLLVTVDREITRYRETRRSSPSLFNIASPLCCTANTTKIVRYETPAPVDPQDHVSFFWGPQDRLSGPLVYFFSEWTSYISPFLRKKFFLLL